MADYGWRNDERRHWDENAARDRWNQRAHHWDDDRRFGGRDRNDFGRDQDFGRESEYGAGYATPYRSADQNLYHRPGGMQDVPEGWRDRNWNHPSFGSRGFSDESRFGGSYPPDYQDYGDWQGQGPNFSGYGGPRFGNNYGREQDAYGRGYRDYGDQGRGFSPSGPDYGDSRETNRNFWNRASDEMASWVGDDNAARRRDLDRAQGHAGRGPKGYTRSDDRIREDVNDRLTDDWRLDASNIEVAVSNGEVTLTGMISSRGDKRHAEDLAESISGVKHVQNNLRVGDVTGDHAGQSVSTPVGSSNNATSLQNRPASGLGSGTPGSSNNVNQTH